MTLQHIQIGDGPNMLQSIWTIQHEFRRHNLKAPASINLASPEEGLRFQDGLMNSFDYLNPDPPLAVQMGDGSVYMEVEVFGIKVRWPASLLASPDGTWRHV